ncbi:MAG: aminotransferase class IV [Armatimonadetes bacterium]|nr:aminotransferase class IV [Armatimonadota bacterium]
MTDLPTESVDLTWVNGRLTPTPEAVVPAGDFGLLYGEGLFETMRARGGRIAYLDRHLERLHRSAGEIGLPLPGDEELRNGLAEILAAAGEGELRARLTVTRGVAGSPEAPANVPPTVMITVRPAAPPPSGWIACWSPYRRDEASPLSRVKSTCFFLNLLARREARARGMDEALLLNTRGELAEGSLANLFLRFGDRLCTPPVEAGLLPGVTRSVLLERAGEIGLSAEEVSLAPEDLCRADAAYATNSGVGIVPITTVEGRVIGPATADEVLEGLRSLLWRPGDFQTP